MENLTFTTIEDDKAKTYKIVKALNYKNNAYVIYTENDKDFYASKYEIINDKLQLIEITDEEVYDFLDKELEASNHE